METKKLILDIAIPYGNHSIDTIIINIKRTEINDVDKLLRVAYNMFDNGKLINMFVINFNNIPAENILDIPESTAYTDTTANTLIDEQYLLENCTYAGTIQDI